jgi:hypothetical protein
VGPAESVAIGIRVKTGRAIAVVLAGSPRSPRVVTRRELVLYDATVPGSGQPYHAGLEAGGRAAALVRALAEVVRVTSSVAVRGFVDELARAGLEPRAAGIVAGSLVDPDTIKNPHMHAHAAEGRLFLEAVTAGLERCGLAAAVHVEKDLHGNASRILRATEGALERDVGAMGKAFGKPWRRDEKTAALAAWVALGDESGRRKGR